MRHLEQSIFFGLILASLLLTSACGRLLNQTMTPTQARLGEETQSTISLKSLPAPKEPVVVAVYKFRDQTGQYKPSETGASWSTAVTQGATTILIKALEDSKWFVPIERENVGNLLNERKIIRSSRAQYGTNDESGSLLPPLLYAGVILEGGIISYDANVITGGAGLRYFGAGASGQYRQDRVTVYLRAISTANGKVLKTVYTSKTILSQAVDVGLFRFVRFSRLLEAETGFSYNEPSELAVSEAIEKAVESLIIEGVFDGLWELEEARELASPSFIRYKKEKALIPQTDIFGKRLNNRRTQIGLGAASSSLLYQGDYPDPQIRTGIALDFNYNPSPNWGLVLQADVSNLATERYYQSGVSSVDVSAQYRLFPYDLLTPYLIGGIGGITPNTDRRFDFSNSWYPKVNAGLGFEYMLNTNIGLRVAVDYNYLLNDRFDTIEQGKYNDFYWRGNIGLNFYFGKPLEGRKFDYKTETSNDPN